MLLSNTVLVGLITLIIRSYFVQFIHWAFIHFTTYKRSILWTIYLRNKEIQKLNNFFRIGFGFWIFPSKLQLYWYMPKREDRWAFDRQFVPHVLNFGNKWRLRHNLQAKYWAKNATKIRLQIKFGGQRNLF